METDPDIVQRKRLVRRRVLALRAAIEPAVREPGAGAAAKRLMGLPEVAGAGTVMAFASFGTEISTDPLASGLLASGRRLLVPLVQGTRMRAVEIHALEELAPGFRGVREPPPPGPAEAPAADVIVVPGVAFDGAGRRLGYGGGFYDVFLSEARGFRVGFCFDCQIVDEVPAGPDDLPVNAVVTEQRTIRAALTHR